jgi:hypothetical protein
MHNADASVETALDRDRRDLRMALKAALAVRCGAGGLAASPVHADPDDDGFRIGGKPGRGWRMIGERQARRSVDRDEMRVRADRAYGAIRRRVFRAPVKFFRVQIHFRNGGSREIEVRQLIERSGATRIIDLPGERRFTETIVFRCKTPPLARERATVQVWVRG